MSEISAAQAGLIYGGGSLSSVITDLILKTGITPANAWVFADEFGQAAPTGNWNLSGGGTNAASTAYVGGVQRFTAAPGAQRDFAGAPYLIAGAAASSTLRKWAIYMRFRWTQRTPDADCYWHGGVANAGPQLGFRGNVSTTKFVFSKDGFTNTVNSTVDAAVGSWFEGRLWSNSSGVFGSFNSEAAVTVNSGAYDATPEKAFISCTNTAGSGANLIIDLDSYVFVGTRDNG